MRMRTHADVITTMKGKLSTVQISEKIIEMVRQHPVLYDQRLQEYRDVNIAGNLWASIAASLQMDGISGM